MKKGLALLLCLIMLAAALAACGDSAPNTPADSTSDTASSNTSDTASDTSAGTTGEAVPSQPGLELISDDLTTDYVIIRSEDASDVLTSAISRLTATLRAMGISIKIQTDWERNKVHEHEIIIGETTREGEDFFTVDRLALGSRGYILRAVGEKLLITGGNDDSTRAAVEYFISTIPARGGMHLPEDYMYSYSPTASLFDVKYGDRKLSEFTISVPAGDELCRRAAVTLRRQLFAASGVLLGEPVENATGTGNIFISRSTGTGVSLVVRDGNIYIKGSAESGISRGIRDILDVATAEGGSGLTLKDGDHFEFDYAEGVRYEDFGAKGDGKTDDAAALRAAHEYANKHGLRVLAREDATYYIGGADCKIVIQTDTDWSCAEFIIDDTDVAVVSREVFLVQPSTSAINVQGIGPLKAGQKNIGTTLPGDCLVTLVDSTTKQYIRYGNNQDSGQDKTDVIIVDSHGNVDASTPILWDFDQLTAVNARLIDSPLSIRGGVFTTIANANTNKSYYYRGIRVHRSNVTFDGLVHYVKGEGSIGAPYYGILIFNGSANSTIKNCVLSSHKTYTSIGSAGKTVSNGSYDITVTSCPNFTAENCYEMTDIHDSKRWGVFASNYAKNITFINCSFSRFDAHRGVSSVTLIGCTFGHQGINLIGHGTAEITDCRIYAQNLCNLRSDYGSTWNGDLIIHNVTFVPKTTKSEVILIGGSNPGSHDFGYTCYLPRTITIDGLYIDDSKITSTYPGPTLFGVFNSNYTSENYIARYPTVLPESITVSGLKTASGKQLTVSPAKFMFREIEISYK